MRKIIFWLTYVYLMNGFLVCF